jgi:SET domain-containing protein
MRDIRAEEEITYDYSTTMSDNKERKKRQEESLDA